MIIIALGANLESRYGTPIETLSAAKEAMRDRDLEITDQSRIWLTEPYPKGEEEAPVYFWDLAVNWAEVDRHIRDDKLICAIKEYRAGTGDNLTESKERVLKRKLYLDKATVID